MFKKLNKEFFSRDAEIVARELLGKILVRKIKDANNKILKAKIIETEAYYGSEDPASRACQNGDLRETMLSEAGTILVYGVHNNWLINFVTNEKGRAEAVLLRALEPLNFSERCNGPGLLTKAMKIDKSFHNKNIIDNNELWLEENENDKDEKNNKKTVNNKIQYKEKNKKYKKPLIKHIENKSNTEFKENSNFKSKNIEIVEAFRIGVKKDLPQKLRFYIKDNKYVSRR